MDTWLHQPAPAVAGRNREIIKVKNWCCYAFKRMRNENWRFAAIDSKAELSSEGKSAAEGNGYVVQLYRWRDWLEGRSTVRFYHATFWSSPETMNQNVQRPTKPTKIIQPPPPKKTWKSFYVGRILSREPDNDQGCPQSVFQFHFNHNLFLIVWSVFVRGSRHTYFGDVAWDVDKDEQYYNSLYFISYLVMKQKERHWN